LKNVIKQHNNQSEGMVKND